ncbi:MAG: LLM class flavin-dependent oxidoreductase, partial [Alphaproteobacteria bacterium]|nr:LLM class flavin-dependent oxidoreductase [Alphaproteobacteria bacterium]
FTLMTPNFTPASTGQPMVPVTLAAVGDYSLRLSGEVADGVRLHGFCTRRYLEEVCLPRIAEGMARTGRKREDFEVTGGGFIATGADDEEVEKAVEWIRYRVAFYGSTPGYWPVLDLHDLGDLGRKLNRMTKEGAWDKIAAEVDDDTLRLFAAVGRHDELADAVEERFGGAADAIYASLSMDMRPDIPPDLIQDIRRLPTAFKGYATAW